MPFLREEEEADSFPVIAGIHGDAQAGGVVLAGSHDGATAPPKKEAVLGGGEQRKAESAFRIGDGGWRPADVFTARQRLDRDSGNGMPLPIQDASFDRRARVGRERERGGRRPRSGRAAPEAERQEPVEKGCEATLQARPSAAAVS